MTTPVASGSCHGVTKILAAATAWTRLVDLTVVLFASSNTQAALRMGTAVSNAAAERRCTEAHSDSKDLPNDRSLAAKQLDDRRMCLFPSKDCNH